MVYMRDGCGHFPFMLRHLRIIAAVGAICLLAGFLTIGFAPPAEALPSYARQTGQPCGTCHTDFAGLTPYGRLFKIQGYTAGGGPYRTTLFPSSDNYKNSYIPPIMVKSATSSDNFDRGDQKTWVPPISAMVTFGLTNTQAPLSTISSLPTPAPYKDNNNITIAPLSFFWGGAITENIGAFAQVTYSGQPPGGFGTDPFGMHTWGWDNTDIRYANSTTIAGVPVTFGVTANNNPTVQDPWNTTPAWAFPYAVSPLYSGLGPGPLLDGAFAGQVASVGAYAFVNNAVYLEASTYHSLSPNTLNNLGADPFDAPGQLDWSPYWRAAYEPHWGNHWLEVGTFGMYASIHPWTAAATSITTTFPQTDKYTDIGLDTQYQYQGDNFWITARGSYIYENQNLNASFTNGLAGNPTNVLSEARAYASLAYGNNNRVVLTGQYFTSWGTSDPILGNPGTKGWIAEIAYIPFISSPSPGWPWFNTRIGLQYTAYTEFAGTTVGASANNTLFLYVWVAM
jgi:hypothetical protein